VQGSAEHDMASFGRNRTLGMNWKESRGQVGSALKSVQQQGGGAAGCGHAVSCRCCSCVIFK
jgi:hypothetical protein